MKLSKHRLSPAMIVALLALFVALAGTGVAATGGNFILGQSNTAGNTTGLSSGTATGPTLALTNTGGKPAARFSANSGVTPFSVSNATRVPSLNADLLDTHDSSYFLPTTGKAANADKLDGIDSTGYIQGTGKSYQAQVAFNNPGSVGTKNVLSLPLVGVITGTCDNFTMIPFLQLHYVNTSADTENIVWWNRDGYGENEQLGPNSGVDVTPLDDFGPYVVTFQVARGSKLATATASMRRPGYSDTCLFQVQASTIG
jgi:hypothetical protein